MTNRALSIVHCALKIDRYWSMQLQQPKGSPAYWLALIFTHTGDSAVWIAIAAWLWHRQQIRAARAIATTVSAIALIVMLVKVAVRRKRPGDQRDVATMTLDQHSFPSGHAARSIGLALTLSSSAWPIGWAMIIGLARVVIGVHYLSDVIAGWSIGFILGLILRHRL